MIRESLERILADLLIPAEEPKDIESIMEVILNIPDAAYLQADIDRTKIEFR